MSKGTLVRYKFYYDTPINVDLYSSYCDQYVRPFIVNVITI